MDDLVITLPCGFTSKYKEIFDKEGKFPCPACMSHMISAQCCVNMTKNKLVINQTRLDLKRQDMSERVKTLEDYKTDPSFYIDEYYSELRNQIDLRREEIKLTMNKKIDDYYENLLETIDKQRESKLNEFRENIGKMSAYKVDDFKILNNLHVNSQLDSINETIKNLDEKINFIDKTIAILTENSLVLNKSKVNWDIGKIFGELETRKEVNYFQNNGILVEIKNQTEATFQLLIDDFSQFKQGKIIDIHSKQFRVQNFLWFIRARSIQRNNGQMDLEFCLQCLSVNDKSDELSANFNAELRLLHTSDYNKNLVFQIGNFLKYKNKFASYSQLITLDELDDPAKGFYNILNDSITLEVWVNQYQESSIEKKINRKVKFKESSEKIDLITEESDSYEDIDSSEDDSGDDEDLDSSEEDSDEEDSDDDEDLDSSEEDSDEDEDFDSSEDDLDSGEDVDSGEEDSDLYEDIDFDEEELYE